MHAETCIFDPIKFPGITYYFHFYNLNQSWLDRFPFLILWRAFEKITSVNSYAFGRSKNLFFGFLPVSSWSISNYFYLDPKENLYLALKIVAGKCKNVFCLLVVLHKRFLSHFSSQVKKLKSLFFEALLAFCLKFSCDSNKQEK